MLRDKLQIAQFLFFGRGLLRVKLHFVRPPLRGRSLLRGKLHLVMIFPTMARKGEKRKIMLRGRLHYAGRFVCFCENVAW